MLSVQTITVPCRLTLDGWQKLELMGFFFKGLGPKLKIGVLQSGTTDEKLWRMFKMLLEREESFGL